MEVSDILSTSSSATSSQTKSGEAREELLGNREDFLTILIAQLKYQDPLEPMEGTEFIDSITRLSAVEQDINQNTNLEKIVGLLEGENSQFGNPVSYLDREVEFKSGSFKMEDGAGEITYNLEEKPENLFIIVRNESGNTVYTTEGSKNIGKNSFVWDGKNNGGNPQSDGVYKIDIGYINEQGENVIVPTYTKGVVKGANFEGEEVILLIDGINAKLEDVISINSLNTETASADS